MLLPREGVVYSHVVAAVGEVTDFASFYSLPSSIIDNEKYSHLRAAYSYYNVATTMSVEKLMNENLIQAQLAGFDVFNALNLMENADALKNLKFGIGDGYL